MDMLETVSPEISINSAVRDMTKLQKKHIECDELNVL